MKYLFLVFSFILLSACGGGGGGDVFSTNTTPDSNSNQGNTANIIVTKFDNSLFGTSEFASELVSTFFDNAQFQ